MSDTDQCRYPGCSEPTREDVDGADARFCGPRCEVRFEHVRADAADRRRGERQ